MLPIEELDEYFINYLVDRWIKFRIIISIHIGSSSSLLRTIN